jgi:hypothetical protein
VLMGAGSERGGRNTGLLKFVHPESSNYSRRPRNTVLCYDESNKFQVNGITHLARPRPSRRWEDNIKTDTRRRKSLSVRFVCL